MCNISNPGQSADFSVQDLGIWYYKIPYIIAVICYIHQTNGCNNIWIFVVAPCILLFIEVTHQQTHI